MGRRSPDGPNPQKKDFHGYDSRSTPGPGMGYPFLLCTSPGRSPGAACNQRNMLIQRRPSGVEIRAPAKVNLFLEVLAKRPDGYHDIATLMTAALSAVPSTCAISPSSYQTMFSPVSL